MTESTDTEAQLRAARNHIIASLNAGLSVQAAIRAAIADGIDEASARTAGRILKQEMVYLKKARALRSVGFGALIAVASFVLGAAIIYYPFLQRLVPIPLTFLFMAFAGGLAYMLISFVYYATAESRVK